uniref:Secreted protein n=1 Tax=Heterorhabditis bacteriophora TaxID=37862 RepID=A0A1I7X5X5_HETBA
MLFIMFLLSLLLTVSIVGCGREKKSPSLQVRPVRNNKKKQAVIGVQKTSIKEEIKEDDEEDNGYDKCPTMTPEQLAKVC